MRKIKNLKELLNVGAITQDKYDKKNEEYLHMLQEALNKKEPQNVKNDAEKHEQTENNPPKVQNATTGQRKMINIIKYVIIDIALVCIVFSIVMLKVYLSSTSPSDKYKSTLSENTDKSETNNNNTLNEFADRYYSYSDNAYYNLNDGSNYNEPEFVLDIDFNNSNLEINWNTEVDFTSALKVFNEYTQKSNHSESYMGVPAGTCILNGNVCYVIQAGTPVSMNEYYIIDLSAGENNTKIYYGGWSGIQKDMISRVK